MRRKFIPNYALYGDDAQPGWSNFYDFEWIPHRSRPYNWKILPHVHDAFVQILYLQSGGGKILINDARWDVCAPAIIVVPAQMVHGFQFTPDVNGPVVTAAQRPLESLAGVVMPELVQTIRTPAVLEMRRPFPQEASLVALFGEIEREFLSREAGQVAAGMSLLTALLVQIARLGGTREAPTSAVNSRKALLIEKFHALIEKKYRHHLPIDAYANKLGISAAQLSRVCREVLGMSALAVINGRLIHEAQRDLIYTSNSVMQIAQSLGFEDVAYFVRFFRKQTGVTPKAFRVEALKDIMAR